MKALGLDQVIESIFKLDKKIRFVAILDHKYNPRESKMREGVTSLTPDQTDRDFATISTPVMLGAAEKLKPFCGDVRRITLRYDRVLLAVYRTAAHFVVLSVEPQVESDLLDKVSKTVRELELGELQNSQRK